MAALVRACGGGQGLDEWGFDVMQAAEAAMAQELKDTPQPAPPPAGGRGSRRVLLKALALVGEVALQGLHVPPAVCNAVQALTADMPLPATG
ncbi:MAG: hypothetical protein AN484_28500, partial [Aphanizomenon flos-aquae WA102]